MKTNTTHSLKPRLETLEAREVPALATLNFSRGILTLIGTSGNDTIVVRQAGTTLSIDGRAERFNSTQVGAIVVDGGSGDDVITIAAVVPTRLYGNYGNDTINGGGVADAIFGGHGNDRLYGNAGNDAIYGGAGGDIVVGGAGTDSGNGGSGANTVSLESVVNPAPTGVASAMATRILQLTNAARAQAGLPALQFSSALIQAADRSITGIATTGSFAHTILGFGSPTVASRIDETRYEHTAYGENIAWNSGYSDPVQVAFNGWMNSSGHRANILNANFTQIGIAVRLVGTRYYFTQVFARPA